MTCIPEVAGSNFSPDTNDPDFFYSFLIRRRRILGQYVELHLAMSASFQLPYSRLSPTIILPTRHTLKNHQRCK